MDRHEVLDRSGAEALVLELAQWDAGTGYVTGVHAGDLGWQLRLPEDRFAGTVHAWWAGSRLIALALIQGPIARPRIHPDLLASREVSGNVADLLDGLASGDMWADVAPGTALRYDLVARDWQLDRDPWVALHADGRRWRTADRGAVTRGESDVTDRVAVQRSGFEGSTFDEASWHRMAGGPGFRPDLDLVIRTDGSAAAAGTGWLSIPGGPAILEPLATHRDHRGRGLGRAAVGAVVDACLSAGASGVSVATPASNTAAVATYVSAGFRPTETVQGLTIRR